MSHIQLINNPAALAHFKTLHTVLNIWWNGKLPVNYPTKILNYYQWLLHGMTWLDAGSKFCSCAIVFFVSSLCSMWYEQGSESFMFRPKRLHLKWVSAHSHTVWRVLEREREKERDVCMHAYMHTCRRLSRKTNSCLERLIYSSQLYLL